MYLIKASDTHRSKASLLHWVDVLPDPRVGSHCLLWILGEAYVSGQLLGDPVKSCLSVDRKNICFFIRKHW